MNNTIKAIMDAKNLTPSRFADEIGVPRPIVSHVLAGRNKPSLDMIQKIAKRFPELGTEWILDETILPTGITEVKTDIEAIPTTKNPVPQSIANPFIPPIQTTVASIPPIITPPQQIIPHIPPTKKIEKILVFYTDKTFDEYTPNH